MLYLECYWYEEDHPIDPKQKKTYESECVGDLIQQAFLEKMAHTDWVGYRIWDGKTTIIESNFIRNSQLKDRWIKGGK